MNNEMNKKIISFNDCEKVRTSSCWICVFCEQSKNCKPFKDLIKIQTEKIIKMYKSELNMRTKFPVIMQDLNETHDEYRKRIREYMEQTNDR